ncbi:YueH family protein [Fictibacillus sp. 7GRE50]|uniref:YueH family protein n=1 Tax=Fictibacillus sp. 7GRE50 TaxID=2745878 RepID=UPI00351C506E
MSLHGNTMEVFLYRTKDRRYIVAIPSIHWSTEFREIDKITLQTDHLKNSLNYHLYAGDTNKLVTSIINLIKNCA